MAGRQAGHGMDGPHSESESGLRRGLRSGGHFFFINRRYVEDIKLYRKALELNPRLWEARTRNWAST